MPDGSSRKSRDFARLEIRPEPQTTQPAHESRLLDKLIPKTPTDAVQAQALHAAGRKVGHVVAHGIEIGGIVLLTISSIPGMVLALGAYAETAHHNHKVHHRIVENGMKIDGHARYADLRHAFGTTFEREQDSSNFLYYKPGRGPWSYIAHGFFGALANRSVVPGVLRHIPARLRQLGGAIEHHLTPNDPLRRHRKRTDVGPFGMKKKKRTLG